MEQRDVKSHCLGTNLAPETYRVLTSATVGAHPFGWLKNAFEAELAQDQPSHSMPSKKKRADLLEDFSWI